MLKPFITSICFVIALILQLTAAEKTVLSPPPNPNKPRKTESDNLIANKLKEAWKLYNFTDYQNAGKIFTTMLQNNHASAKQKLQARIGQAFIINYRQPGSDPLAALEIYQTILSDLPENHPYRSLVLSRIGACYFAKQTPDFPKGRKYLTKALKASPKGSVLQQECILRLAISYLQGKTEKNKAKQALSQLQKNLPLIKNNSKDNVLEGAIHNLAAGLALLLDNPELIEKELESWEKAGIQNFTFRAEIYFKIARINELVSRNFNKARKYYEKIAKEEPSDSRAYFSRIRAKEIADGQIWNGNLALPHSAFKKAGLTTEKKKKQE